jgi:putative toxin-antitoxin system antitoxin component (TIGR02293 family)
MSDPVRVTHKGAVRKKAKSALKGSPVPRVEGEWSIKYERAKGVKEFARKVGNAGPFQVVYTERSGVPGRLLRDIAIEFGVPNARLFHILGIPKATAERKIATNGLLKGAGGNAALGILKLLDVAQRMVDNSTALEASHFDTPKWLGEWIESPQPALGGKKPADLLDTPTGVETVAKVLRAMESGVYL